MIIANRVTIEWAGSPYVAIRVTKLDICHVSVGTIRGMHPLEMGIEDDSKGEETIVVAVDVAIMVVMVMVMDMVTVDTHRKTIMDITTKDISMVDTKIMTMDIIIMVMDQTHMVMDLYRIKTVVTDIGTMVMPVTIMDQPVLIGGRKTKKGTFSCSRSQH